MPQSVTQYRRNTGDHVNWSDKQQGNQKKQNKNIQQLAAQPGSHAGNRDRQRVACAAVQLLSVLSSVQNTDTSPAITSRRTDELAAKERIVYADTLYRGKMVERVINREVMRNSGQNSRAEHSPKTQDSSSEQHRASSQRADYPTVHPMPDQVQPADSPL